VGDGDGKPDDSTPAAPGSEERGAGGPVGPAGGPGDDVRRLAEVAEQTVTRHLVARGFLIGAGVTLAMTLFVVQNTRHVGFHWLWFTFTARLWVALLVASVAGAVASPLLLGAWQRSRRNREKRLVLTRRVRAGRKSSAASSSPSVATSGTGSRRRGR